LEKSSAHQAQFQALVTMKDALLREWSILGAEAITSIRDGLIKLALTRGAAMVILYAYQQQSHDMM
jgi:hypothetical protein